MRCMRARNVCEQLRFFNMSAMRIGKVFAFVGCQRLPCVPSRNAELIDRKYSLRGLSSKLLPRSACKYYMHTVRDRYG